MTPLIIAAIMATFVVAVVTIIVAVIAMMAVMRPIRMAIHIRTTMDVIYPARSIVERTSHCISWWIDHHWTDMGRMNRMHINWWRDQ